MNADELPAEILAQLEPAKDAIREEVRHAIVFSPYEGGLQRVDRAGLAVARSNDGGGLSYQQGLNEIMDRVVGRSVLKEMREARRTFRKDHGRMMVEGLREDYADYVDRDPDLIDRRARGEE